MAWFSLLSYVPPTISGTGANGAIGGGWTDVGSVWRLANLGGGGSDNVLQTSSASASPWTNAQLVRKAANEATQNAKVRIRWQITAGGNGNAPFVALRYVPNSTDATANCLIVKTGQFFPVTAGALGTAVAGTGTISANAWYDTEVTATTNGTSTTLTEQTWSVTNHMTDAFAAGPVIASNSYTTTTFNTASGALGLFAYQPGTLNVQQFQSFSDVPATALALSPSSTVGAGGSAITLTMTANGAQNGGAVTLADGGAGGTFSPASITMPPGVGASQTFTYTPAAASSGATVTITATSTALTGSALSATSAVSVSSVAATALAISPQTQSLLAGSASAAFTVAANGGLAGATTVTLSDGAAGNSFSPTTVTLTSGATSATFVYNTSVNSSGTITLTASASGLSAATASVSVAAASGILSPAHASVVLSPYNWVTGLANTNAAGNTAARCWNPGAYARVYVSGCSSLSVVFGASNTAATFMVQIDDNVPSAAIACPSNGTYAIALPDSGPHTVTWTLFAIPQATGRWAGTNAVVINGFQPGPGGSAATATRGARKLLIYGDSIAEGIQSRDGSDGVSTSFAYHVGESFRRQGWEYGIKAAGASGYSVAVASNLGGQPAAWTSANDANSSWNKVDGSGASGAALTTGSVGGASERFIDPPDLILDNWGANDGIQNAVDATVQVTAAGLFQRLRVAAPNTVIVKAVPFGGYKRAAIQAAVTAAADTHLVLVDTKVDQRMTQSGYCGNLLAGTAGNQSIHPWSLGSAILGNYLAGLAQAAFVPFATARAFGSAS